MDVLYVISASENVLVIYLYVSYVKFINLYNNIYNFEL